MKAELLSSLNRRFCDVENNEALILATILDPSFKDKFFTGIVERSNARELLENKVEKIISESTTTTEPPAEKRAKTVKCFDEIIEEAGSTITYNATSLIDLYLNEPLIPHHCGNAFTWWDQNKIRFKPLSSLAMKYLSAPPTSVPSEQLFSSAGDIYDEKRNCLAPERAESVC